VPQVEDPRPVYQKAKIRMRWPCVEEINDDDDENYEKEGNVYYGPSTADDAQAFERLESFMSAH